MTTSATVPGKRKRRRRFRRSRCRLEKPSVLRRRVSFVVLRKRLPRNESLRLIPCRASCRSAYLGQDRPTGAASLSPACSDRGKTMDKSGPIVLADGDIIPLSRKQGWGWIVFGIVAIVFGGGALYFGWYWLGGGAIFVGAMCTGALGMPMAFDSTRLVIGSDRIP